MKKKILLLMGVFSLGLLQAQVGVNTENPLELFHVDGQGNSSGVGVDKYADDVVVTKDGNIGVGTISPQAKVHIVSDGITPAFRLQDGSEIAKKIIISDANGVGTWGEAGLSSFGVISYEQTTFTGSNAGGTLFKPGLKFEFPSPGVYLVSLGIRVITDNPGSEILLSWAQLLPTIDGDIIEIWRGGEPRFAGSYEVPRTAFYTEDDGAGGTQYIGLFDFNQSITITADYQTMYLVVQTGGWAVDRTVKVAWGTSMTPLTPDGRASEEVGGSYIKIK